MLTKVHCKQKPLVYFKFTSINGLFLILYGTAWYMKHETNLFRRTHARTRWNLYIVLADWISRRYHVEILLLNYIWLINQYEQVLRHNLCKHRLNYKMLMSLHGEWRILIFVDTNWNDVLQKQAVVKAGTEQPCLLALHHIYPTVLFIKIFLFYRNWVHIVLRFIQYLYKVIKDK